MQNSHPPTMKGKLPKWPHHLLTSFCFDGTVWDLYVADVASESGWRNYKLLTASRPCKANYTLARYPGLKIFAVNHDTAALRTHLPELYHYTVSAVMDYEDYLEKK